MKRLLCCVFCFCVLLTAGGCAVQQETEPFSIVCSAFPQYDFLRELTAGAPVSLSLLLKPGQESHDYDPSSRDIASIHHCDVFVYVGGESDSWIDRVLQSVDTTDKAVVRLMDMVAPVCEEHHHEEHHHHAHEETYDEHVWTSPQNAVTLVAGLLDTICQRDPQNAALYRQNAAAYTQKLQALDAAFEQTVQSAARQTIVVADRFPLLYFTTTYRLTHHAAFAGCATAVEPASADVQALIQTVKRENIPVVFQMELSESPLAQTVREQTGCEVRTFYACHNLSKTDFENGETYLSLMQKNLTVLKEALY